MMVVVVVSPPLVHKAAQPRSVYCCLVVAGTRAAVAQQSVEATTRQGA